MQRLSGLDASFLYLETPSQPMHVCSIIELDTSTMPGGYTFDRLRDALSLRIKAMPQFREKLANSPLNLDHPVWVDDENFEIDRHLHRIGLPRTGRASRDVGDLRAYRVACRWTAGGRCGRCGSSKAWRAPIATTVADGRPPGA